MLNGFPKSRSVPFRQVFDSSCMHAYKLWALMVHLHKHTHEQMSEVDSSCWLLLKHTAVAMQTMPHSLSMQQPLCTKCHTAKIEIIHMYDVFMNTYTLADVLNQIVAVSFYLNMQLLSCTQCHTS